MGRAKLNLEFITKEKARTTTFNKRKKGLIRKLHELTILCDVTACIIIYGPKKATVLSDPEVWPADRNRALQIIHSYRAKNKALTGKTYGLPEFWHDRLRKAEDELAKVRKKNMEAKYPTWLDSMNCMSEHGLRAFAAALARKAENVRSRIEALKAVKLGLIESGIANSYYYPHAWPCPNQSQHFGLGLGQMLDPLSGDSSMIKLLTNGEYINGEIDCKRFDNQPSLYCPFGGSGPLADGCYMPVEPVSMPPPYGQLPLPPPYGYEQEGFDAWWEMNNGRGRY